MDLVHDPSPFHLNSDAHIQISTRIRTCIHTHTHACIFAYVYTYRTCSKSVCIQNLFEGVHTHLQTYTVHTCMHAYIVRSYTFSAAYINTHNHKYKIVFTCIIHIHTGIHIDIVHAYMHMHVHTHTDINIHMDTYAYTTRTYLYELTPAHRYTRIHIHTQKLTAYIHTYRYT